MTSVYLGILLSPRDRPTSPRRTSSPAVARRLCIAHSTTCPSRSHPVLPTSPIFRHLDKLSRLLTFILGTMTVRMVLRTPRTRQKQLGVSQPFTLNTTRGHTNLPKHLCRSPTSCTGTAVTLLRLGLNPIGLYKPTHIILPWHRRPSMQRTLL